MAFLSLVFGLGGERTSVGAITLDALMREETKLTADVTSYPVESGAEISDHITRHPEELSVKGQVTAAGILTFQAGGRSRLIESKSLIRDIHEKREPITIQTGIDTYTDYAMTSAVITRDNTGEKLVIDAQFRKVNKVNMQRAEIPQEQVAPEAGADTPAGEGSVQKRAGKTALKVGGSNESESESVEPTERQKDSWLLSGAKAIRGMF